MNQMVDSRCSIHEKDLRVVHCIPGRIRVRSDFFREKVLNADYVEAHVCSFPGVIRARLNVGAGCLAVRHEIQDGIYNCILQALNTLPAEAFAANRNQIKPITRFAVGRHLLIALSFPALSPFMKMHMALVVGLPIIWDGIKNFLSNGISAKSLDSFSVTLCLALRNFPAVAVIGFMRIFGDYLKQQNDRRSNDLLVSLLRSKKKEVWVERSGVEVEIPFDAVCVGDIAVFGPGELVAIDGEVIDGSAVVNKSMITGESIPVCLEKGSVAVSGSVVESGRIRVRAEKVGSATSMSRVNSFLEQTLKDKSLPELKGDRLADKLVPLTLGLSGATYAVSGDLSRTASMASIDYVCSVKFPACFSVKSSIYAAARSGMLLTGGSALDALAKIDTVVFDKTGTLTRNRMKVCDIVSFGDWNDESVLSLAARIEQHYEHPLAKAVVDEAHFFGLDLRPVSDVEFVVSRGVCAKVEGQEAFVGSRAFVLDKNLNCTAADICADTLRAEGKIVLYVAQDGVVRGLLAMRDCLRPEAAKVIAELKESGIEKVVLLTGDHSKTSAYFQSRLDGIDELYCELSPEDKACIVKGLKKQGKIVAVIGDGVNDAPALAEADLGICMAHGGELARLSAQAVLLNNDLRSLCAARRIALRQHKILDHCYRQGALVNTGLLALAAMGGIAPLTSAALHNLNTFGLVGYSVLRAGSISGDPDMCPAVAEGNS